MNDTKIDGNPTTVTGEAAVPGLFEEVPGTRLLVDYEHLVSSSHGAENIVLIPTPSDDPDDPLNWSRLRQSIAFGIVLLYSFLVPALTLSAGVTYGALIVEFDTTPGYLNTGAALGLLFIGISNLFWNPMAHKFGRRPVYLLSSIITCASVVATARAQSKEAVVWIRLLIGFAAGPFEQLPAVTVADQFFTHQRGLGLSIYVFSAVAGSFLGPLASGFVVESMGWRWVNWFYAIFMGVLAIIILFGLEETCYVRKSPSDQSSQSLREANELPQSKRSYVSKLNFWTIQPLSRPVWDMCRDEVRFLFEPIVFWAALLYGFGIAWLTIMVFTANSVFQNPEFGYNFSFSATGLTNIAPLVGGFLSLYIGGAGTDRFMIWQARRNNGIMEPESRIYAVFIGGPIMAGGLILYGAAAAAKLHWIAPVIGMAMIGVGIPIAGEVSLGYVSESYTSKAGDATAAVIVIRNIIGCAMVFATEPWINHNGLQDTFIIMGCLCLVVFMSGGIFIWQGKNCRRRAARSKIV